MSKMGRYIFDQQQKENKFTNCHIGQDVCELVNTIGNDQELGTKVRALILKYNKQRQQG